MKGVKSAENSAFSCENDGCEDTCANGEQEKSSKSYSDAVGVPPELLGIPLIDFDLPGGETFVVVAKRFGKQVVYRFNREKSLYLFSAESSLRHFVIYVTTNQYFELFILLLIITNCVILAFNNSPEEVEYVFAALYTVEMILKIIGKGFCLHRYAYLRDAWNWMDFVVVILGYLTLAPSVGNLSGIRTFRVLRALRTISVIDGLRTMVNAFLRSMRMLTDVLILAIFFISLFALIGMQLFGGVLRNKCVLTPGHDVKDFVKYLANDSNWLYVYDEPVVCGNASTARSCPVNYTCFADVGDNPNHDYTSFDSFSWALLSTLQLVTADYWENTYEHIIASQGFWYLTYFLMVIFFGSFYLLNLILAVVALSYQQELANLKSQAAGYDNARRSSSSYSLHVSIRPKRLFETIVVPPLSNWSSLIHRLAYNSPYGNSSGSCLSSSPTNGNNNHSPRPVTQMCTINVEQDDARPFHNAGGTPPRDYRADVVVEHKTPSKLDENHLLTSSTKLKRIPIIESPARAESRKNQNQLSVENGLMLVQTSSLCVVIPSFKDVRGHRKPVNLIRRKCSTLITKPMFEWFITIIIFINTIFMAAEYHGMDRQLEKAIDVINLVCTFVFILELFLKLIALSPRGYVQSHWNLLDGFIVLISMIDVAIFYCVPGVTHSAGLSVLRSLRLLRVLKLAQSWVTMRALLSTIGSSVSQLGNLTLLLAIVAYTFAVIGMQLFSESFDPDKFHEGEVPRWNFSDFLHSFMIIFRVLCGEWIEPLVLTMHVTSPTAALFYLAVLVLGNFLILNLFLALLLNSFATESLNTSNKRSEDVKQKFRRAVRKLVDVLRAFRVSSISSETRVAAKQNDVADPTRQDSTCWDNQEPQGSSVGNNTHDVVDAPEPNFGFYGITREMEDKQLRRLEKGERETTTCRRTSEDMSCDASNVGSYSQDASPCNEPVVADCFPSFCCAKIGIYGSYSSLIYSGFIFCRSKVLRIVQHKLFDGLILFVIVISSVCLAFEDVHLDSKPSLKSFLLILNYIVTGIFTLEFVLKVFGLGVVKYFGNPWNCLDFVIVVISVISLANVADDNSAGLVAFRSLRTLRALRPLRAIPRWQGMKVVVNSLFSAIPKIGNVSLVCFIFWLIFSVMGVQFFSGLFYKCVGKDGETLSDSVVPNKTICLSLNYTWKNSDINFDNTLAGLLALFQVATFEGWIEIMADAADATKIDQQPRRDSNHVSHLYFVIFVLFGSFFVLNLFVGVIIDNFTRLKKQYEGRGALALFLTDSQRAWYDTLKKAASRKPRKVAQQPKGKWRAIMFHVVRSPKFELAIMLLIFSNMVIMMIRHHGQSETVTKTLDVIFSFETILRLTVLRWDYFKEPWNDFDLLVVLLSIIGIILEFLDRTFLVRPSLLRVVRVFRVGRLLRFYDNTRGIRRLLFALLISLPALVNIGALLFLVLFIYAIIGMSLFGNVKHSGAINDMVNFETFGHSMLLLFRLSTSAGWNDVLGDLMVQPPDCDPTYDDRPNGNCGSPYIAVFYFCTLILFTSLIIINMYIAVILENLYEAFKEEAAGITDDDLDMFYRKWELFDPLATQSIPHSQLGDFVDSLEEPLRIPKPNKFACIHLNIPIQEGDNIHCVDVLQSLIRHSLGDIEQENPEGFLMMQKKLEEGFNAAFPARAKQRTETTTFERNREICAAISIQKAWRAKVLRNKLSREEP